VRTVDHTSQLRRIDRDYRRNLRHLTRIEWVHRVCNVALLFAAGFLIRSTIDLVQEPATVTAAWLILELIAVDADLIIHLFAQSFRVEFERHADELRQELELKGDELRQSAAALGIDLQQFLSA
jgi:hypothetical protein